MFSANKKSSPISNDKVDTLVGKSTTLEGTLTAEGTIRIDGNIIGEVIVSGNVIIGETSTVKGNIQADNAHVAGLVQGNVTAKSQLYMTTTAKLTGDITTKTVIIDEGAIFTGNCKIINEEN